MAKLEYEETLVDSALALLEKAKGELSGTEENVKVALNTISSARGVQLIDTKDVQSALGLATECQDTIDSTILAIKNRVEQVKQYNKDVEDKGFFTRIFATAGLALTKVVEGIGDAGEQLVDGFASAVGFVVGFVDKGAQDKIAKFVAKDHVGDAFQNLYNNQFSEMVKASYMKENGKAAKLFKIAGTAIGYTAIMAAGGAAVGSTGVAGLTAKAGAQLAMGSLKLGVGAAMVGSLGATQQVCLQSGMKYNDAFKQGMKAAVISGVTVIGVNYALRGLGAAYSKFKSNRAASVADDVVDDVADDIIDDTIPKGSNGTEGGSSQTQFKNNNTSTNGSGSSSKFADGFDDIDDAIKAAQEGKITPEQLDKIASDRTAKLNEILNKNRKSPNRDTQLHKNILEEIKRTHPDRVRTEFLKGGGAPVAETAAQGVDDLATGAGTTEVAAAESGVGSSTIKTNNPTSAASGNGPSGTPKLRVNDTAGATNSISSASDDVARATTGSSGKVTPGKEMVPYDPKVAGVADNLASASDDAAQAATGSVSKELVPVKNQTTDLVPVKNQTTDLVPVTKGETGLVPVTKGETGLVPVTKGETGLVPVTKGETGLVPVPPPKPPVTKVVAPVPPKPPVLVTPITGEPIPPTQEPIIAPKIEDPIAIIKPDTPPPPDPIPKPIPDPIPDPDPIPKPIPDPDPIPDPIPTPIPDPDPIPDPIPTPIPDPTPSEYEPIPNTGVSRVGRRLSDYAIPAAIGVATGAVGALASLKHRKDETEDDSEEERDDKEDNN